MDSRHSAAGRVRLGVAGQERAVAMTQPLTKMQAQVLAVIQDARAGEISGLSIATWLLRKHNQSGIATVLRSLQNRGLICMRPLDDPNDKWRRQFPDRMKAMYSIRKDGEECTTETDVKQKMVIRS